MPFCAPDFRTWRSWSSWADLSRGAQELAQFLAHELADNGGELLMPRKAVAYQLGKTLRSVAGNLAELRSWGIIVTKPTRNRYGGTGPLSWTPGPLLERLSRAMQTGQDRDSVLRGEKDDTPLPHRGETALKVGLSPKPSSTTETSRSGGPTTGRRSSSNKAGSRSGTIRPATDPDVQELDNRLTAAIGRGWGAELDDITRFTCRKVARVAVSCGAEAAAVGAVTQVEHAFRDFKRKGGTGVKVPGGLLVQRFVDALAAGGLQDVAREAGWGDKLRSTAARIDRNPAAEQLGRSIGTESARPTPLPDPTGSTRGDFSGVFSDPEPTSTRKGQRGSEKPERTPDPSETCKAEARPNGAPGPEAGKSAAPGDLPPAGQARTPGAGRRAGPGRAGPNAGDTVPAQQDNQHDPAGPGRVDSDKAARRFLHEFSSWKGTERE